MCHVGTHASVSQCSKYTHTLVRSKSYIKMYHSYYTNNVCISSLLLFHLLNPVVQWHQTAIMRSFIKMCNKHTERERETACELGRTAHNGISVLYRNTNSNRRNICSGHVTTAFRFGQQTTSEFDFHRYTDAINKYHVTANKSIDISGIKNNKTHSLIHNSIYNPFK